VGTIFGGISICPDLQNVDYFILDTIGFASYQWGVVGGTIITPTNNDSIQVDWGGLNPNASIFMIPTNVFNCVGDTITVPIDINPIISSPPPVGPTSICLSDANTVLYSVPFTTGYNYTWSNPGINHNLVPVNPGNQAAYTFLEPGIARIFVEQNVTTPTSTCLGLSDTLEVTIHPDPDLSIPIVGDTSICEFTPGNSYTINGFPNSSYQWSIFPGGNLTDTSNTVTIDWDTAGTFQVVAFETTEFGCTSGDVFLEVQINPIPETEFASVDTFVCAETVEGNTYITSGFDSSSYVWDVVGGSFEQNDSSSTAVVTWDPTNGTLEINVFEISQFNCIGDPITYSPTVDLSLPLVSSVSLTDPEDTFSTVEIFYNKGNANSELIPDSLTIYRKRATEATWTPIGRVASSDSAFIDTDQFNRLDNFYEYQVSTVNSCANEIFSPQHNTIRLEGEGVENIDQLNLFWNEYVNWENGVRDYEIYRRVDDEEDFVLYESTGAPAYSDFSANDGFDHYFRIRAIESGTGFESWSNEILVEFENVAEVADVITPNGDGKNDTWKIDNIELYPGTQVKVFNRWGYEVYSTDNYQGDWAADGLPGGTYFFQAVFKHLDEPVKGYIEVLK
jgi:gliding motility-associated-like protein